MRNRIQHRFISFMVVLFLVSAGVAFTQTEGEEPFDPSAPDADPFEPPDMEEPPAEDPMDPMEPVDPQDPSDPQDPQDPQNPQNPQDPSDPQDPLEPADPEDPQGPTDPGATSGEPQADISDEELESLAVIQAEMLVIQQETQSEVDQIIEDAGIRYDEFLQMYYSLIGPDGELEGDFSDEVDEEFVPVIEEVVEHEQQADEQIDQVIEEHGYDEESFNELSETVASDPVLSEELNDMISRLIQDQQM